MNLTLMDRQIMVYHHNIVKVLGFLVIRMWHYSRESWDAALFKKVEFDFLFPMPKPVPESLFVACRRDPTPDIDLSAFSPALYWPT